jgi:hypothetical protein
VPGFALSPEGMVAYAEVDLAVKDLTELVFEAMQ